MKDLSRLPGTNTFSLDRPAEAMMALEFNHRTVNLTVGDFSSTWFLQALR